MKQEEKEMEIYRKMDMHITQEILDMINNRDMVKHLLWEAKSRSRAEECNIYVYWHPEWVNATVTPKYKGEENLFFKVEYNPLTN